MSAKNADHVVMLDGGKFLCTHCRVEYDPIAGGNQPIGALAALMKWFAREHAECEAPSVPGCSFCGAADHDCLGHVNATCKTARDWPTCGDTGISSRAIYQHMMGQPHDERLGGTNPWDSSDVGRCVRLLDAPWATGWRERMGEMAGYPGWGKLIQRWAEIEALCREEVTGEGRKCYDLINELLGHEWREHGKTD